MKSFSRTPWRVVAGLAIVVVVSTSCGDDDDESSSTETTVAVVTDAETTSAAPTTTAESSPDTSSTPASGTDSGDMCTDREALSASVDALTNVDLRAEGTNGVTAAVDAVKNDLTALQGSLNAELQPQGQAVRDALDEVETAVADLGSGGAAAAATAVSDLSTAAETLFDSLQAGACG